MKKFFTVFLAVILSLVMGVMMIGCSGDNDPDKEPGKVPGKDPGDDKPPVIEPGDEGITLGDILSGLNFEQGFTIGIDLDYTMEQTVDMFSVEPNYTGDVSFKAKLENNKLKADALVDLLCTIPAPDMPGMEGVEIPDQKQRMATRTLIRGDKVYTGDTQIIDKNLDDMYYEVEDISDVSSVIGQILPGALQFITADNSPINNLISSYIEFEEDGDAYKAEIDLISIVNSLAEKVKTVCASITNETTIGNLYTAIGGNDLLQKMFGDQTCNDLWTGTVATIKDVLTGLPEGVLPEEMSEMFAMLDEVDSFDKLIEMLNENLDLQLPAGNSTKVVDYIEDNVLTMFSDMTLNDLIEDPEHPEITAEAYAAKISSYAETIGKAIAGNTAKLNISTYDGGAIKEIKIDADFSKEMISALTDLFGGEDEGLGAMSMDATITFTYSAEGFIDVTTLKNTSEKAMAAMAGTYELKSIGFNNNMSRIYEVGAKIDYVDENGESKTLDVTKDTYILTLNANGTGTVEFNGIAGEKNVANIVWHLYANADYDYVSGTYMDDYWSLHIDSTDEEFSTDMQLLSYGFWYTDEHGERTSDIRVYMNIKLGSFEEEDKGSMECYITEVVLTKRAEA